MLPYGCWGCADGRLVLFNRHYRPIQARALDGEISLPDPDEWVKWKFQNHFYDDGTRNKAAKAIEAWEMFLNRKWDWTAAKLAFREIDPRLCRHSGCGSSVAVVSQSKLLCRRGRGI
jgi:hypothetical protein